MLSDIERQNYDNQGLEWPSSDSAGKTVQYSSPTAFRTPTLDKPATTLPVLLRLACGHTRRSILNVWLELGSIVMHDAPCHTLEIVQNPLWIQAAVTPLAVLRVLLLFLYVEA